METLTLTLAPASSASHSDHRNMFITLLLYKGAAGPVAAAAAGGRGAPDLGGQEDEDLQGPAGEDEDEDGQGPGAAEDEELQVR